MTNNGIVVSPVNAMNQTYTVMGKYDYQWKCFYIIINYFILWIFATLMRVFGIIGIFLRHFLSIFVHAFVSIEALCVHFMRSLLLLLPLVILILILLFAFGVCLSSIFRVVGLCFFSIFVFFLVDFLQPYL